MTNDFFINTKLAEFSRLNSDQNHLLLWYGTFNLGGDCM